MWALIRDQNNVDSTFQESCHNFSRFCCRVDVCKIVLLIVQTRPEPVPPVQCQWQCGGNVSQARASLATDCRSGAVKTFHPLPSINQINVTYLRFNAAAATNNTSIWSPDVDIVRRDYPQTRHQSSEIHLRWSKIILSQESAFSDHHDVPACLSTVGVECPRPRGLH